MKTFGITSVCAPFAVKSIDDGARSFRGIASTWERDLGGDIVHKGAFTRTLSQWRTSGRTIALTDGHPELEGGPAVDRILGKMIDAVETDSGLETEYKMRDTQKAEEALEAIRGGFMTDLSMTYKPIDHKRDSRSRHLHEVYLHSVGLVAVGMNPGAKADAASVKSLLDAARAGTLTDDERAELRALLTDPPTPADEPLVDTPKGLAPNDPRRLELSARLRGLNLRSLTL